VAAVGLYVIYGVFAAGFVMVAVVLAFHPPETLRIIVWVTPVSTGWQEEQIRCRPQRGLCDDCANSLAVLGCSRSITHVMTAASIAAGKGGGYARY